MANKNKAPVDTHSREEFEDSIKALEGSGITYMPRSKERELETDWQIIRAAATDAERALLAKLDRLYANAQRLANEENKRVTKKDLETMRGMLVALNAEAEERARQIGTEEAQRRVSQIAEVVTHAIKLTKQQRSDLEGIVSSVYAIREGLAWLDRESPLARNKYGEYGHT